MSVLQKTKYKDIFMQEDEEGKEFLKCIKEHEQLCSIPVVVLTCSDNQADIEQSYKLYAAGYAQKPLNAAELDNIVKKLVKYWFTTSSLL